MEELKLCRHGKNIIKKKFGVYDINCDVCLRIGYHVINNLRYHDIPKSIPMIDALIFGDLKEFDQQFIN